MPGHTLGTGRTAQTIARAVLSIITSSSRGPGGEHRFPGFAPPRMTRGRGPFTTTVTTPSFTREPQAWRGPSRPLLAFWRTPGLRPHAHQNPGSKRDAPLSRIV